MSRIMLMDAKHPNETRVVIMDDDTIEDFDFVTSSKAQLKGNIYLAKITRVEPSLQAAFVEYGGNKQGFLPFSEIHPDYYQIPVEDRKRLLEEEAEEAEREEAEEEAEMDNRESGRNRHKGRGRGRRHRRGGNKRHDEESASPADNDEDGETAHHQSLSSEEMAVASEPLTEDDDLVEAEITRDEEETVETVVSDEAEERPRRRGSSFKRYRIQEVIKRNQIVLVQVIKEERGNKGCSLTTYISLAGRYCVLMPNSPKGGGVSRKISNGEQRRKLKEMLGELKEKRGFAAIIRTAGLDRTKIEIKRDYEYLVKMWSQIREDTLASNAPALIYEESDIIKRSIRDLYTNDIEQVLVQGEEAYKDSKTFMKMLMPSHAPRVKLYKEDAPIFAVHGVEEQLASMYEPTVKMPSGGYVVIQATEALTSIDVNSGRSTTERNVEETAIKTNLEAAREVARQLRLRDVAGLIVVDFIDMYYGKNRRTLEKAMKDYLKHDRAKIQVSRISPFGLVELSRQRLRPSIAESSTVMCDHCQGVGFVKSLETVSIQIIRLLEREAVCGDYAELKVLCTADVAMHLLNDKRHLIQEIESFNDVTILVKMDRDIHPGNFRLYKTGDDGKEALHQELESDRGRKRKGRGRRGGRGRRRRDENDNEAAVDASEGETEYESSETTSDNADDAEGKANNAAPAEGERKSASGRKRGRRSGPRARTQSTSQEAPAGESGPEEKQSRENQPEEKTDSSPKEKRRASTRRTARKSQSASSQEQESTVEPGDSSSAPQSNPQAISAAQPETLEKKDSTPQVNETEENKSQPKRKGWWNRVMQGTEDSA